MKDHLTSKIIQCCYQVMNELGAGFFEKVYQNALAILLKEQDITTEREVSFEVLFRNQFVGFYKADLVVEGRGLI